VIKYFFVFILLVSLGIRFLTLEKLELRDGQSISFESRLTSEPQQKKGSKAFQLFYKGNRIYVYVPTGSIYSYGDILKLTGRIKVSLLNNKTVFVSMYFPRIEAKKDNLALLFGIRQSIISVFEKSLPSNYSALLLGIVFGIKSPLSNELSNNLKILGLMHVIAASGMNVALIGGFLSSVFLLFLKRQKALALTIIGIIIYAFLAGFEPSIVRASIMGTIAFTAQILGRQRLASYSLILAAFIMILFSPYVIWDIGFQLSFLSTAGLIYIKPVIYQIGFLKKFLSFIVVGDDISTTVAAQLATFPILLANFGLYSIFSVIINALVLWTIPALMVIGGLGFIFSVFLEPLGRATMYLSFPFLIYFEFIINLFSNFSGAISVRTFSWPFIASYYLLLVSFIWIFALKRNE